MSTASALGVTTVGFLRVCVVCVCSRARGGGSNSGNYKLTVVERVEDKKP